MALQLTSFAFCPLNKIPSVKYSPRNNRFPGFQVRCMVPSKTAVQTVDRRSEMTFQKHFQEYDLIESLTSKYLEEPYTEQANKLKEKVRMMVEKASKPLDKLELVDTLGRLGLAYLFKDEIKRIVSSLFQSNHIEDTKPKDDLYATALEFRILREHGYSVSAEVFNRFKDEKTGNLLPYLSDDVVGMLSLYEASYFSVEGESILDDARDFTTKNLAKYVKQCNSTEYLSKLVSHALGAPLAWTSPKMEASWFISAYESKEDMEPILLELAKLDFNMVQAIYQEDMKDSFRWWKSSRIPKKLSFSRDWLMENFLYAAVMIFEPQYKYGRRMVTKINQLFTTMDDIYDVYGTIDELELLTDAVARWDINAADHLPDYMKLFFLALYNTLNETAYDVLKEQGLHIIPYLKKVMADYCKAYLTEAKWYHSGYTPTLQEYLDNASISMPGEPVLGYAYFCLENPITKEAFESLEECPNIFRLVSLVMRLADDLATCMNEMKRGDVPKSIQCYMNETGASKEEARDYIRKLLLETWKKFNREAFLNPQFSQTLTAVAVDMARLTLYIYPDGDEYDAVLLKSTNVAKSLFFQPIP